MQPMRLLHPDQLQHRPPWLVEPKLDGWRLQIHLQPGQCRLYTRRQTELTHWPGLAPLVGQLACLDLVAIWDAELCAVSGRPRLASLKRGPQPIRIYLFDSIGPELCDQPLQVRKGQLALQLQRAFQQAEGPLLQDSLTLLDSAFLAGSPNEWFHRARTEGWEGLVFKRLYSPYRIGRLGPIFTDDWLKWT